MARESVSKKDQGLSCNSPRTFDQFLLKWALNDKETNALGVLYAKYYERLKRYIAQRIHSVIEAEDLAQEVFIRLWETRAHYEIKESVEAYLFTVARNAIALYLRQKKNHEQSVPMDSIAEVATDRSIKRDQKSAGRILHHQLQKTVQDMTVRLSPKAYEAIKLRFIEGLSVKEAAQKAGCSVKAFYSRQERSLKELKQMIVEKENG
jgi:RNA polymerase sigma-70 factor (ECF subfamily)